MIRRLAKGMFTDDYGGKTALNRLFRGSDIDGYLYSIKSRSEML